jgi:hypothetical protein
MKKVTKTTHSSFPIFHLHAWVATMLPNRPIYNIMIKKKKLTKSRKEKKELVGRVK